MPRSFSIAQMNVPSSVATGALGSRPRSYRAIDAVRSGAPMGRFWASISVNRIRFEPHVRTLLMSTGRTSGELVLGSHPSTSSGTVGAAGQAAEPDPGGDVG